MEKLLEKQALTLTTEIYEGTLEVQRIVITREIIKEYNEKTDK